MKLGDNPDLKNIKGDNSRDIIICADGDISFAI